MNALTWTLAAIAYLVFSYSFALLNLWAWKNRVQVMVTIKKNEYGREDVKTSARFMGIAHFLWPYSASTGNPRDCGPYNSREDRRDYLVTMTLGLSWTKVVFLSIELSVWLAMNIIECAWEMLCNAISKLPGAKKVL